MRALLALALLVPLAGCFHAEEPAGPILIPVSSFGDVHGLAVSPADGTTLYVATHRGLVRGANATGWVRVGASADDLMGFTAHPANGSVFWSSGHPAVVTATSRNLGVRVTGDGGFTWTQIGLSGVDLHAMTVSPARPSDLWGYASSGQLHRSRDGGVTWELLGPASVRALAGHPVDHLRVLASSSNGILRSTDGGASWAALSDRLAFGLAFDRKAPDVVYAATGVGVAKSTDGGATWGDLTVPAHGGNTAHVAISPKDSNLVYVATYEGAILRSTDAGATWTSVKGAG